MKCPRLVHFLILLLAGCSKPPSPPSPPPPVAQETAKKSEAVMTVAATVKNISYTGTWSATDGEGQLFDIVVFPNGQAVSNWTKGPAGAHGERGFWRLANNRLLVFFQDGWTDVISEADGSFKHRGFEPGSAMDGPPKNESPARRLEDDRFTGVWCLNKEPDGSYLYVALQSSGRAFSTIGGGTEGTWEQTKEGALCKWPDGWNDLIFASNDGFQKRSWVGAAEQNTTPPDISPALRVGDTKFFITP
ncbi:MAG: hypothetical protein WCO94_07525 [Verrucomicrobiota bacterium]